jgi:hypothetical protein
LDGIPIPFAGTAVTTFSTSEESKSKIPVEKRDSNLSPAKEEHSQPSSRLNSEVVVKQERQSSNPTHSSSPHSSPEKHQSQLQQVKRKLSESTPPVLKKKPGRPPQSDPPVKTSQSVNKQPPPLTPAPNVVSSQECTANMHGIIKKPQIPVTHSDKFVDKRASQSRVSLVPLILDRITSHAIDVKEGSSKQLLNLENHCIEKENNVSHSRLCAVRLHDGEGAMIWEAILSTAIVGVSATEFMTCVVCNDNTLNVFSTISGRRLFPPFVLSSPVSLLSSKSSHILIITMDCKASLFDFSIPKCILKNESMDLLFMEGKVLRTDLSIVNTTINENRCPVISLSNRKSFVFDMDFQMWILISEPHDLSNFCSDIKQPQGSKRDTLSNPLAAVQSIHRSVSYSRQNNGVYTNNTTLQANATISFLDHQVTSALTMKSPKEYCHWLLSLVQVLTDNCREERLRELCLFLLGHVFCTSEEWKESSILGLKKRDLLQSVLQIMTSNLRLQRLYLEMKDQLKIALDNEAAKNESASSQSNEDQAHLDNSELMQN